MKVTNHVCPHCGYCDHCGRGGSVYPWRPPYIIPSYPLYPYYGHWVPTGTRVTIGTNQNTTTSYKHSV